jgi:hypothetical protein
LIALRGNPCLLGETLPQEIPGPRSFVSPRCPTGKPEKVQATSLPKFHPTVEIFLTCLHEHVSNGSRAKEFPEFFLPRTRLQRFLATPPLSSFKKLVISTPRLVQGLRMMLLAKAVPKGIKDGECKRFALQEHPPVMYVPEKDPMQETVSLLKSNQSLKITIGADAELCLPI